MKLMRFFVLSLLLLTFKFSLAQPKSTRYEKSNDFLVAVLWNPNFSLYDFIEIAGLHESNTQFLDEMSYRKSKNVVSRCKELYGTYSNDLFHEIYMKISASWQIFLKVQNTDTSFDGMGKYFYEYNQWDTDKYRYRKCPYPELKHYLSIVPLKLEEY